MIKDNLHQNWRKASLKYRKTLKGMKNRLEIERFYREKYKTLLYDFWGNKCVGCGFSDSRALQIDHVEGKGSKHMKYLKLNRFSYYKKIYEEVINGSKDYQPLCANCNWIKRWTNKEHTPRKLR